MKGCHPRSEEIWIRDQRSAVCPDGIGDPQRPNGLGLFEVGAGVGATGAGAAGAVAAAGLAAAGPRPGRETSLPGVKV